LSWIELKLGMPTVAHSKLFTDTCNMVYDDDFFVPSSVNFFMVGRAGATVGRSTVWAVGFPRTCALQKVSLLL